MKNMPLRLVVSAAPEEVAEASTVVAIVVAAIPTAVTLVLVLVGVLALVGVGIVSIIVIVVSVVVVVVSVVIVVVSVVIVVSIVVRSSVGSRRRISRCCLASRCTRIVCTVDQGLSCRGACTTASSAGRLVSLDRGLEVGLVDLDLLRDTIERLGGLDVASCLVFRAAVGVGLLNGKASTKGTSQRVIAASDSANVSSGGCVL